MHPARQRPIHQLYKTPTTVQLSGYLNVRTVTSMTTDGDLTGRARIRNAALTAFARDDGASIRAIAKLAGCSPALVQHHFGSKERLRDACDDYVLAYFREQVAVGIDELGIADPAYVAEVYRSAPIVIAYLNRRLVENSPKAQGIFDSLVAITQPYLRTDAPTPARDRAAVLVAMKLGVLLLRAHVDRALGPGGSDRTVDLRISAAQIDLLDPDLAPAEVMAAARKAAGTEAST